MFERATPSPKAQDSDPPFADCHLPDRGSSVKPDLFQHTLDSHGGPFTLLIERNILDTHGTPSSENEGVRIVPPTLVVAHRERFSEQLVNPNIHVFHTDDKDSRLKEIRGMLEDDILPEDSTDVRIHSSLSRKATVHEIEAITSDARAKILIVLTDVFGKGEGSSNRHDMSFPDFADAVSQSSSGDAVIIPYSASPDARAHVAGTRVDGLRRCLDREANFRERLRSIFLELGIDCRNPIPLDSLAPKSPTSHLISAVQPEVTSNQGVSWESSVREEECRFGALWSQVEGNDPNILMNAIGSRLCSTVEKQMEIAETEAIKVKIMGMSSAREAVYLAEKYPKMEIATGEIDSNLRATGEGYIQERGLSDRIKILRDCHWQTMDEHPYLRGKQYNLVICLGNKMDCVVTPEEQDKIMNNVYRLLTPQGHFLLDIRQEAHVKKMRDEVQRSGIPVFNQHLPIKKHPHYPYYTGPIIGYDAAIQGEGDRMTVLHNYPVDEKDNVLLMKLTPLEIMHERCRRARLNPEELWDIGGYTMITTQRGS